MEQILPLLLAGVLGFTHAFEFDHLVAVSNIVTRRHTLSAAVKDGVFWGLGHSSTILLIGFVMLLAKVMVQEQVFHYLEAAVGVMLVVLGVQRMYKWREARRAHAAAHAHDRPHGHQLAYGVGLVHGLAGSGSLVLLVMTQLPGPWLGMVYLLIFGLGSTLGMLLASGLFSLPFTEKMRRHPFLQQGLSGVSAVLCIFLGVKIVFENLTHG
jgi:threonine/homoserine/homoserine lactone efflux protein